MYSYASFVIIINTHTHARKKKHRNNFNINDLCNEIKLKQSLLKCIKQQNNAYILKKKLSESVTIHTITHKFLFMFFLSINLSITLYTNIEKNSDKNILKIIFFYFIKGIIC